MGTASAFEPVLHPRDSGGRFEATQSDETANGLHALGSSGEDAELLAQMREDVEWLDLVVEQYADGPYWLAMKHFEHTLDGQSTPEVLAAFDAVLVEVGRINYATLYRLDGLTIDEKVTDILDWCPGAKDDVEVAWFPGYGNSNRTLVDAYVTPDQPTMINISDRVKDMGDAALARIVSHEFGHTLGFRLLPDGKRVTTGRLDRLYETAFCGRGDERPMELAADAYSIRYTGQPKGRYATVKADDNKHVREWLIATVLSRPKLAA